jgi:predicted metallopeptidase
MARSPRTCARIAAVLGIFAAALLANPAYVGLAIEEPRERSPTGDTATAIDPANESDQRLVVRNGTQYVFTEGVHVDDFGPGTRGAVTVVLSALGALVASYRTAENGE